MNLLVTGGAGYIGSHFCKYAVSAGHNVVVFDNLSTGHAKFVQYGSLVKGDIRDGEMLLRALRKHKIEAVVHFAAKALIVESVKHPELYYDNNVSGTLSLLAAMRDAGVNRIIFSSSGTTYGVQQKLVQETSSQIPISPYGMSKKRGEEALREFHLRHGFAIAILRYFNVIGQDPEGELREEHDPETHILPNIFLAEKQGRAIEIYGRDYPTGDGTCVRDYVDVNDLAKVHLRALECLSETTELISNVGRGYGISVKELVETYNRFYGARVEMCYCEPRPGDPPFLVADNSFFKNWYPLPLKTLEQSLEDLRSCRGL